MDKRPIGVFDSGLGGLTVVKKIAELLPGEDIIYLGDTGRVPYGSRSRETIIKYAHQDAAFLTDFNIKAMVIACNTVCSVAFKELENKYDIPVYEVVAAPSETAANKTINKKIGIIGTAATIRSSAYESALKKIDPDINVFSVACPLFVPLVEEGWTETSNEAAISVAERYLCKLRDMEIDTLILGCTHYPLLKDIISNVMSLSGNNVILVDSGEETAKFVTNKLKEQNKLNGIKSNGSRKYFVTDSIDGFSNLAAKYLDADVQGKVQQVVLE